MIRLTENGLWIGNSLDSRNILGVKKLGAILNVAQDLTEAIGWPVVEYMQVGLIDGPGNPLSAYYAAVLALDSLLKRHKTLICCHSGSRSMAVSIMYMEVSFKRGWDDWVEILNEKAGIELPVSHDAHKLAFERMNWRLLAKAVEDKV